MGAWEVTWPDVDPKTLDLEASGLGWRPGQWPEQMVWQNRHWVRESPKFGPSGALEAFTYATVDTDAVPEVQMRLVIWND